MKLDHSLPQLRAAGLVNGEDVQFHSLEGGVSSDILLGGNTDQTIRR